MLIWNYKT